MTTDTEGPEMTLFATLADGRPVHQLTLSAGDLSVDLLTYGAVLQHVRLAGIDHDLSLGSDDIADYQGAMRYYGALIGPVANRISGARATVDGAEYRFVANNNRALLHSGRHGTQSKIWQVTEQTADRVRMSIELPDGADGFPGTRRISLRWQVLPPSVLRLEIEATTDERSLMNPVNHSYWNLNGTPTTEGQLLRVAADHVLPIDAESLPTGEIAPTAGSDLDFRAPRPLAPAAPALDHNFCLSSEDVDLREVAELIGDRVSMRLATTAPGLQVYDGRDCDLAGFAAYAGLALEPQRWPDAPHNPAFPDITLDPGKSFRQVTEWRFSKV